MPYFHKLVRNFCYWNNRSHKSSQHRVYEISDIVPPKGSVRANEVGRGGFKADKRRVSTTESEERMMGVPHDPQSIMWTREYAVEVTNDGG